MHRVLKNVTSTVVSNVVHRRCRQFWIGVSCLTNTCRFIILMVLLPTYNVQESFFAIVYIKVVSNWFYDQMIYLNFWKHDLYDISLLKKSLKFLQVWYLENLKGKETLDMIAMIHWGNIHLVKTWKEIETLM